MIRLMIQEEGIATGEDQGAHQIEELIEEGK